MNTIFTYENNLGTANFSDPSFVPLFLDEQPTDKIDQAAAVCGGTEDRACVFDFIATSNEALALRTKAVKQQFDTDEIEDGETIRLLLFRFSLFQLLILLSTRGMALLSSA